MVALFRTPRQVDVAVRDQEVIIRPRDIDVAARDRLGIRRFARRQRSGAAEDHRQKAAACRGQMQDDENGSRQIRSQSCRDPLQCLHSARRRTDHDNVAVIHVNVHPAVAASPNASSSSLVLSNTPIDYVGLPRALP